MTIKLLQSDLLKQSDVDAIVNTVNCVGVMGKGIALQFKNKWPQNFSAYAAACKAGDVRLGRMFLYDAGGLIKPNYIINFPTKQHWRGSSEMSSIREGLADLIAHVKRLGIRKIAIPPLGCGNGGLAWTQVRPLIEAAFEELPDVEVRLFEPGVTLDSKDMDIRTTSPAMTPGRAAILKVIEIYREMEYGLSKIEVQKLAYFLQLAGEEMRLKFVKQQFGPYSEALKHALNRMDGHFIRGVGDGVMEAEIEPIASALAEADAFLAREVNLTLRDRVERVARLIYGFQTPYGMELLASVHWVASTDDGIVNAESALAAVQAWNPRKKQLMSRAHVQAAYGRLRDEGWLRTISANASQAQNAVGHA